MTDNPTSRMLVGIDAGGTRSRAVAVRNDGQRRWQAAGGPGNFQILGLAGFVELCRGLIADMRIDPMVATLCAAVAGAGRLVEQDRIKAALLDAGVARQVRVVSDARAALEGAHAGQAGLVVIAGTGSIIMGRNASGLVARAGGWGPLLGDEGSAHGLVMAALQALGRAHDGSGPPTMLTAALLRGLALSDWDALIPALYGGRLSRQRLASLCPLIFASARAGDEVAIELIGSGARRLAVQAVAVARRLELRHPAVALAGGLGEAEGDWLWEQMMAPETSCQDDEMPVSLQRISPRQPPVEGALLLAFEAARLPPSAAVNSRGFNG